MIYDNPVLLDAKAGKRRIFSPLAYKAVRDARVIEITMTEASRYPTFYPIVWQKSGERFRLVIVRSLLADGRGHYTGLQNALGFLPRLAQAYPFLLASAGGPGSYGYLVDDAIADQPTDIGAPICLQDGRPSRATQQRLAMLEDHRPEAIATQKLTDGLAERDLLEPWPLEFADVEGARIEVPQLYIINQSAVPTGRYSEILRDHGASAAWLLGWHRISIFRAGQLLAAARNALRQPAKAAEPSLVLEQP